jgi:hypothetical protein
MMPRYLARSPTSIFRATKFIGLSVVLGQLRARRQNNWQRTTDN